MSSTHSILFFFSWPTRYPEDLSSLPVCRICWTTSASYTRIKSSRYNHLPKYDALKVFLNYNFCTFLWIFWFWSFIPLYFKMNFSFFVNRRSKRSHCLRNSWMHWNFTRFEHCTRNAFLKTFSSRHRWRRRVAANRRRKRRRFPWSSPPPRSRRINLRVRSSLCRGPIFRSIPSAEIEAKSSKWTLIDFFFFPFGILPTTFRLHSKVLSKQQSPAGLRFGDFFSVWWSGNKGGTFFFWIFHFSCGTRGGGPTEVCDWIHKKTRHEKIFYSRKSRRRKKEHAQMKKKPTTQVLSITNGHAYEQTRTRLVPFSNHQHIFAETDSIGESFLPLGFEAAPFPNQRPKVNKWTHGDHQEKRPASTNTQYITGPRERENMCCQ